MSNNQTLKTCPCCGGKAEFKRFSEGFDTRQNYRHVLCIACGLRTKAIYKSEYDEDSEKIFADNKVVELWNTRIHEHYKAEVQRLRSVITDFCNAHQNIEGYSETEMPHEWYDFFDAFDALKKERNKTDDR